MCIYPGPVSDVKFESEKFNLLFNLWIGLILISTNLFHDEPLGITQKDEDVLQTYLSVHDGCNVLNEFETKRRTMPAFNSFD